MTGTYGAKLSAVLAVEPQPSVVGPALRQRVAVALFFAVLATGLCYVRLRVVNVHAADFSWSLRGAERLLASESPYRDPLYAPTNPYPYDKPLFYPLPALLVALPFTLLEERMGAALFFGLSSGILAFGLSRDGFWRLICFLGAPYWVALLAAQWSPLLMSVAVLPALAPLMLAKPQLGLPVLLAYGTRRGLLLTALAFAATLAYYPTWPLEWISSLGHVGDDILFVPLLALGGPLLLLAALRWRAREARLLLLMALVPQRLVYDQLVLWLVCRTRREALVLAVLGWVGAWGWLLVPRLNLTWMIGLTYLPALVIVLRPLLPKLLLRLRARQRA